MLNLKQGEGKEYWRCSFSARKSREWVTWTLISHFCLVSTFPSQPPSPPHPSLSHKHQCPGLGLLPFSSFRRVWSLGCFTQKGSWHWVDGDDCFNPVLSRPRHCSNPFIAMGFYHRFNSPFCLWIPRNLRDAGTAFDQEDFSISPQCLPGKRERNLIRLKKHQVFKVIWNPLSVSILDSNQEQWRNK